MARNSLETVGLSGSEIAGPNHSATVRRNDLTAAGLNGITGALNGVKYGGQADVDTAGPYNTDGARSTDAVVATASDVKVALPDGSEATAAAAAKTEASKGFTPKVDNVPKATTIGGKRGLVSQVTPPT